MDCEYLIDKFLIILHKQTKIHNFIQVSIIFEFSLPLFQQSYSHFTRLFCIFGIALIQNQHLDDNSYAVLSQISIHHFNMYFMTIQIPLSLVKIYNLRWRTPLMYDIQISKVLTKFLNNLLENRQRKICIKIKIEGIKAQQEKAKPFQMQEKKNRQNDIFKDEISKSHFDHLSAIFLIEIKLKKRNQQWKNQQILQNTTINIFVMQFINLIDQQHFIYKNYPSKQMSIRQSKLRSGFKETLAATDIKTHRKNQYSFASPFRNTEEKEERFSHIKFRSPLREQEVHDYNKIKTELKKGIELAKQNISLNQSAHYVTIDEYNILNQEYKYETERLLFEIAKLHETISEVERNKNLEIQKLKDDQERNNYLNLSNVRQGHTAQVQMLQAQLRKTKELLNDKTSEYQNVIKRQQREIKHLNNETNRLNSEIKTIIQQKNAQLQIQQKSAAQRLTSLRQEFDQREKQLQQNRTKQINKINKSLQNYSQKLQQSQGSIQNFQTQNGNLLNKIQNNRLQNLQKLGEVEEQTREKYIRLKSILQKESNQIITQITKNYQIKEQVFQNQISQLKKFLILKNQDRQKLIALHQERLQFANDTKTQIQRENQQLKNKLSQINQQNQQDLQIIKVKMAALHQNDIQILIRTYQTKIQALVSAENQRQQTINRLRRNLYEQTNHRHQMRKKYSIEVSKLNERLIKLRSGLTVMQSDMKEKLQNEKSMLLLTSRNLIKDVEAKTSNARIYEIQLAKLQQAYRKHAANIEQSGNLVDEKIRIAEEQLERLSKHIVDEKSRHQQTQNTYKEIVKVKDSTIQSLRHELQNIKHQQFNNTKELQMIQQLKAELHDSKVENAKLKDKCELLQKKINIMKAELDQYEIEHQISQQEAKKEYQRISHENMDQFQKFYEGRIATLQQQKLDLKELISSKEEKITSLVQKYQQLQKTMKSTLAKIKKRTDLENKVMNLGTDNNLIKNMAEIVRTSLEQKE